MVEERKPRVPSSECGRPPRTSGEEAGRRPTGPFFAPITFKRSTSAREGRSRRRPEKRCAPLSETRSYHRWRAAGAHCRPRPRRRRSLSFISHRSLAASRRAGGEREHRRCAPARSRARMALHAAARAPTFNQLPLQRFFSKRVTACSPPSALLCPAPLCSALFCSAPPLPTLSTSDLPTSCLCLRSAPLLPCFSPLKCKWRRGAFRRCCRHRLPRRRQHRRRRRRRCCRRRRCPAGGRAARAQRATAAACATPRARAPPARGRRRR